MTSPETSGLPPNRRQFLAVSGLATSGLATSGLATATALSAETKRPDPTGEGALFTFGLMADCQYVDGDNKGARHYRKSPDKLRDAVRFFNQHELSFCLHLGDFIDRDFKSFDLLQPIIRELKAPLHHLLGNHDFEVDAADKAKVPAALGLERGYSSWVQADVRIVLLDTTEHSTYRHAEDSALHQAAVAELKSLRKAGAPNAAPWNSRPGDGQLAWLKTELEAATRARQAVLLFGHHPIQPKGGLTAWGAEDLHELIRSHPCVKAYINGHHHPGNFATADGIHYLTLKGMVEAAPNAYALAHLFPDRLEIVGFGREPSRVLSFR